MARRARYINQKNASVKNQTVLLVDAGGFSAGIGKLNKIKTEYLLRGFKMLNYSAVNLGYRDFLHGTKFIEELKKKFDIPFVSSNIYNSETGKPLVDQFILKSFQQNGKTIKIAILGLEAKNSSLIPAHRRQGGALLEARNPVETARTILNQIKNKVDLTICLAHMRLQTAKKLAEEVPELDVIILGNDFRNQETVTNDGKTRIVSAGRQGKYVGDLIVNLDQNNKIISHKHIAVALDDKYKDVQKFTALVKKYKNERLR